jgi:calcineurin-like phosphoesterase family protein
MIRSFFTADTHFSHKKVIEYDYLTFVSVEEMNETIVSNWNSKIAPDDYVYHLGDVGFGKDIGEWVNRLNGHKFLIRGNHDRGKTGFWKKYFEWVQDDHFWVGDGYGFYLRHRRIHEWVGKNRFIYHLHGHSHGKAAPMQGVVDVGMVNWKHTPLSADEIINILRPAI